MAPTTKQGTRRNNRPPRHRVPIGALVAAAVVIVVVTLIGLNLVQSAQNASTIVGSPPTTGAVAPDFQATTLSGQPFRMSAERGRVVALYFAAAWCPTCVPEAQAWTRIYQQDHSRGLDVVMVDVDTSETAAQWADFRLRTGNGPQIWLLDKGMRITSAYGVTSLETSIIVDRQGRIADRIGQTIPQDLLQQDVEKLL